MIILGEPDNFDAYYYADGDEAFELHQAGFMPKYKSDDGGMYFKRTNKLVKWLESKKNKEMIH